MGIGVSGGKGSLRGSGFGDREFGDSEFLASSILPFYFYFYFFGGARRVRLSLEEAGLPERTCTMVVAVTTYCLKRIQNRGGGGSSKEELF